MSMPARTPRRTGTGNWVSGKFTHAILGLFSETTIIIYYVIAYLEKMKGIVVFADFYYGVLQDANARERKSGPKILVYTMLRCRDGTLQTIVCTLQFKQLQFCYRGIVLEARDHALCCF